LILKHRDTHYVNADPFEDYVQTVFLPQLLITHLIQTLREEDAVLLMDNCSPQPTPVVLDLLSTARVWIVAFAPHTTQIFQVIELALFRVSKRRAQYQSPFDDHSRSARFINNAYHDLGSTTADAKI
jgi:hypothetical protein